MLKLNNIVKVYKMGDTFIHALNDVSLEFEQNGFVSILGPSGCGKTTMLNLIGGLDVYSSGDLIINGKSTRNFKARDWDNYRNKSIGFVFQNYNLISHQSVLRNVELALTLSGVSDSERKKRAKEMLSLVGLADQFKKKPNQLSGGQMQRVAIARALVNNPDIILADEPTGALDSETSVAIMEILKKIAKQKLVIMVTHNGELADKYSNRIIRLKDGQVLSDTRISEPPAIEEQKSPAVKGKKKKSSMSFFTALNLSFKNLITKKVRTFITAFAGSIGIIGVALVLSISNGVSLKISDLQSNGLAGFPLTISKNPINIEMSAQGFEGAATGDIPEDAVVVFDAMANMKPHENVITQEYVDYIKNMDNSLYNDITYGKAVAMNIFTKRVSDVIPITNMFTVNPLFSSSNFFEIPGDQDFILSIYDIVEGNMPKNKDELLIVIDNKNRIEKYSLDALGFDVSSEQIKFSDIIGKEYKLIPNDKYYNEIGGKFAPISVDQYADVYENEAQTMKVVGIIRVKPDAPSELFGNGIGYMPELTDYVLKQAENSAIAKAQAKSDKSVLFGQSDTELTASEKKEMMQTLGADSSPSNISIYPKDFDSKEKIKNYLEEYNNGKSDEDKIVVTDIAKTITGMFDTMLTVISVALISFAAISLVVSSIMIGIITYVSVLERTKEIGILRSIGARKKDIGRVFNAETIIIGAISGGLGVGITYLLTFPINSIVSIFAPELGTIAVFSPVSAAALIVLSMGLTLIAGLVPSHIASNKNPVTALRTE